MGFVLPLLNLQQMARIQNLFETTKQNEAEKNFCLSNFSNFGELCVTFLSDKKRAELKK
jgi:hypothetical protein